VVAAAVILHPGRPIAGLRDSKLLSERERDRLAVDIRLHAVAWSVAWSDVAEIDRSEYPAGHHARHATRIRWTVRPAGGGLDRRRPLSGARLHHACDRQRRSRRCRDLAASILAKTARDALLVELDGRYPAYGFAHNRGYGTPEHLLALAQHGPCPAHRMTFAPVAQTSFDF
jgi:ribonuclease HII